MKEFLWLWAFSTTFFTVTVYILMLVLVLGAAFVTWNIEPIQMGWNQLDWTAFRVTIAVSIVIGFFVALMLSAD